MPEDGIEITFEGLPEFNRMMEDLAGPAIDRIARRGLRAGAKVVQAAIAERAPERPELPSGTALPPGALKSDIVIKIVNEPDGPAAYIEPGKFTLHVARLVEYGHRLVRGGQSHKGGGTLGQGYVGPGAQVGYVQAHPFVRPAFESSSAEAEDAVAQEIAASFTRGYQVVMPDDEPGSLSSGEQPAGLLGSGE